MKEYILNTEGGLTTDFPPDTFGFNMLQKELAKAMNPDIEEKKANALVKPFPLLKFRDGEARVVDESVIKKAIKEKDDKTLRELTKRPWTIQMVRETAMYKQGKIWELSKDHIDQMRAKDGYPSLLLPEDFEENKHSYLEKIQFIKQQFVFDQKDQDKLKKQCDECLLTLQKVKEIFRIVNIPLPREQENLAKYSKSLEACRLQVEVLLEDSDL